MLRNYVRAWYQNRVILFPFKVKVNYINCLELMYSYDGIEDLSIFGVNTVRGLDWKLQNELDKLNIVNKKAAIDTCSIEFYSNFYHFNNLVEKVSERTGIAIEYKRTHGFKAVANKGKNYIHLPDYDYFSDPLESGGAVEWWSWSDNHVNKELVVLAHELAHHVQFRKGIGLLTELFSLVNHPDWDNYYSSLYKEEKHALEKEAYAFQHKCEQYTNKECMEIVKLIYQLVDLIIS